MVQQKHSTIFRQGAEIVKRSRKWRVLDIATHSSSFFLAKIILFTKFCSNMADILMTP
jgi:hypothetical protein